MRVVDYYFEYYENVFVCFFYIYFKLGCMDKITGYFFSKICFSSKD